MNKKIVVLFSVLAVLFLIIGVLYYRSKNKTSEYYWRSVTIEKGDVNVLVTATGTLAADTSVDVGVQVSGIVAKIKADFNDAVKKGQVIAVLDTTLYYSAKLDAAATLQKAQVATDQAKTEYERSKQLFENGVVPKAENDLAVTSLRTAQANLISAQALLSRASINLRYCTVTAPINGMIISRNVEVGNMVIASFNSPVLFIIANNLSKMQVQTNVDEADIGLLLLGQQATFTVDAYPNKIFKGEIKQIRHQPVVVLNVVNYVVIIEVENPELKLMPGLTANANIFIEQRKNVLKVATNAFSFTPPVEYIQESLLLADSVKKFWIQKLRLAGEIKKQEIVETIGSTGYLWIIKDKDVFPMQVTKGLNDGSFTEINGLVQEGFAVATGINSSPSSIETKKSKSPFMPTFPSRKK